MSDLNKIIKSFDQQKELNTKIWNNNDKMTKKVRDRLIEISNEFVDFIGLDIVISDIIMTGSLANYNWSEYSDIDLHLIVDFNQFSKPILPLYEDLFKLKKTIFNEKHDITIYGYEVELYIQNESETHFSSGVYSVLNDEWINKPKKQPVKIDKKLIKNKVNQWMKSIDSLLKNLDGESIEVINQYIKNIKDKLKKYRTSGLEKGGENSDENLVFKSLRRNGYIQKLFDFENQMVDKKLSINENIYNKKFLNEEYVFRDGVVGNSTPSDDKIDPDLLKDIQTASNNAGVKVAITTAIDGHKKGTRHEDGYAVDIAQVYDDNNKPQGFSGGVSAAKKAGIYDKINSFVSELEKLGYKKNVGEEGNNKVVLTFGFKDHNNHIHVSNVTNRKTSTNTLSDELEAKIELAKKSTFLEGLKQIAKSEKSFENLKKTGAKIPYQKEVEFIQTGLQFLGYSLPKWGIDGLFGPETEKATKDFKKNYNLGDDGIFDTDSLKYLYAVLIKKDFSDSDLSKIQKKSDFSNINIGNDKQFYEEILKGIGAPITESNMRFLLSWRQAEGGRATNNPFNTTFKLKKDKGISDYNKAGVKNYSTAQFGVEATVKTLLNGRYSCILDGLKNDIGAEEISKCQSLKTWGTGNLVYNVVNSGKLNPPKIYS